VNSQGVKILYSQASGGSQQRNDKGALRGKNAEAFLILAVTHR
jgi:hypothetical protein